MNTQTTRRTRLMVTNLREKPRENNSAAFGRREVLHDLILLSNRSCSAIRRPTAVLLFSRGFSLAN